MSFKTERSRGADYQPLQKRIESACNCKRATITFLALCALSGIIIGFLCISSSFSGSPGSPESLSLFRSMGWEYGTLFVILGVIAGVSLVVALRRETTSNQKEKTVKSNSRPNNRSSPIEKRSSPIENSPFPSQKEPFLLVTAHSQPLTTPSQPVPEPDISAVEFTQIVTKMTNELGITDFETYIAGIYDTERPDFKPCGREKYHGAEIRIKLMLSSDEQILDLETESIEKYTISQRMVVYQRLLLMDKKGFSFQKKESPQTLRSLRLMGAEEILASNIPKRCRGMLRATQIDSLLSTSTFDPKTISLYLPINDEGRWGYNYTYQRLKMIQQTLLFPHLEHLTFGHYRLLPLEYFKSEQFPWQKVAADSENGVKTVLGLQNQRSCGVDAFDRDFTVQIFGVIGIKAMTTLAPVLTLDYFPVLSDKLLLDPAFPWLEFIKREKCGSAFHCWHSTLLAKTHFPWLEFAKYPNEVKSLFSTVPQKGSSEPEYYRDFTISLLNLIDISAVNALVLSFSLDHLSLIPKQHLQNSSFNWRHFIGLSGIGYKLHSFTSDFLLSTSLPWKELIKFPTELKEVFSTSTCYGDTRETYDSFTKNILSGFDINFVNAFVPFFALDHLSLIPKEHLQNPSFNWRHFIGLSGIGYKLHSFTSHFLLSTSLPWEGFIGFPLELKQLFSTSTCYGDTRETDDSFTKNILARIDPAIAQSLKQAAGLTN